MINMSYISILFLFGVPLSAQSTSFECEQMGMCSISINETEFSCGVQYTNITLFDFPREHRRFWRCICDYETDRDGDHVMDASDADILTYLMCKVGEKVKKVFVCYQFNDKLQLIYRTSGRTPMTMLTTCLLGEPSVFSKFRFVRSHGNLISSNMSFAGTNTLENRLYEIAFDNNQITTLKKNDFSKYTDLRVLSLRKNQITTIEIGALPSPENLEVLDIGNNFLDSNSICYLKNLTEVWENVSIVAEYISDGSVLSIDNYQQCTVSVDTGTTVTDTILTAMPRTASSGVQIIMAIIGCICGIVSVITLIASIMKMFGKGKVEVQQIEIRQVAMEIESVFTDQTVPMFDFGDVESGSGFKNMPPLNHHVLQHNSHRD